MRNLNVDLLNIYYLKVRTTSPLRNIRKGVLGLVSFRMEKRF